jgi:hypothetical protein
MKNQTGYRQMLRDRLPKLVDFALKWCKAKESWLDHVYHNFIWLYSDNNERLAQTRLLLGYKENKQPREFVFADTIDWDNLNQEEEKRWKTVASWVSWFQCTVPLIEDEYKISKTKGAELIDLKRTIMLNWLSDYFPTKEDNAKEREQKNAYVNKLADYLIDCFENLTK